MELIKITHDNIEKEHICCAITNSKDCQVADTAEPYFELLYFPFDKKEPAPCFRQERTIFRLKVY